jgi:hypothetical protein
VAARLRRELAIEVDTIRGHYGEYKVLVDGDTVVDGGPRVTVGIMPSARRSWRRCGRGLPPEYPKPAHNSFYLAAGCRRVSRRISAATGAGPRDQALGNTPTAFRYRRVGPTRCDAQRDNAGSVACQATTFAVGVASTRLRMTSRVTRPRQRRRAPSLRTCRSLNSGASRHSSRGP